MFQVIIFIFSTIVALFFCLEELANVLSSCMQTWMYLSIPVLMYAGERTLRFFRSGSYTVHLLKVSHKLSIVSKF